MIENLQNIGKNPELDEQDRSETVDHILRNIYYLSGYAIEGVVNYCIYKLLEFPSAEDVERLQQHNLYNNVGSCFRKNTGICFNRFKQGNNGVRYYSISNHNFAENIEILKKRFPSKFNKIPIISKPENQTDNLSVMFYKWSVKIRYQTDTTNYNTHPIISFKEREVLEFFTFVRDEIYTKLPLLN
jgi:hypothetical protein